MKMKILVIGPEEAGKTVISNIIVDTMENYSSQYEPTIGVRIFEIEVPHSTNFAIKYEVELWDCSGSLRYQPCWPALQHDVHGIIFVHNPEMPDRIAEMELFYDYFVVQSGLKEKWCLILVNFRKVPDPARISFPPRFKNVETKLINAVNDPNHLKFEFNYFVEMLANAY